MLAALDRANPYTGNPVFHPHWVLSPDEHLHACPSCHCARPHYLDVQFWGDVALADLYCWHYRPGDERANAHGYVRGCTEAMIVAALDDVLELDATDDERRDARVEVLRARREAQIRAAGLEVNQ